MRKIILFLTIGIIFLSAFMRLYRFEELFHWTMDEEFWNYLPYNIASGYHFPLIGGHIAGTGLYSGPLFIYLMAIPSFLFSGNPLGLGVTVSIVGVVSSVLMIIIGKKIFNQQTGLIAGTLYAGSFLMTISDRHYWNASLTPILSLLSIWFLFEIIKNKKYILTIPLAFVLALAFHAHGTGMAILLFSLISWCVFNISLKKKGVVLGIILFCILQFPLIFFDLRHNMLNSRALITYMTTNKGGKVPISDRLENIATGFVNAGSRLIYFPAKDLFLEQTLGLPKEYQDKAGKPPILVVIIFISVIAASIIRKKDIGDKLIILSVVTTLAGLLIYKEKLPEYFFSPTYVPLIFLMARMFRIKILTVILLAIFIVLNLRNILTVKHTYSYDNRLTTVEKSIAMSKNEPFTINVYCNGFCQPYGFRYLYTYLKHEPIKSYMDTYFSWLYDRRISELKPNKEFTINLNEKDNITIIEQSIK